jgi:hypothetical protein
MVDSILVINKELENKKAPINRGFMIRWFFLFLSHLGKIPDNRHKDSALGLHP